MNPVNSDNRYEEDPCLSIFRGRPHNPFVRLEDYPIDDSPDEKSRRIAIKNLRARTIKAQEEPRPPSKLCPKVSDPEFEGEGFPRWILPQQMDPNYLICENGFA